VFWIAEQPLTTRIDDEIERFQRNLPDQHRHAVGHFERIEPAFAALDDKLYGAVQCRFDFTSTRGDALARPSLQPELNQLSREREHRRAGVDQGVRNRHLADVRGGEQSAADEKMNRG
jgi:hypothetical protein